MLKSAGSPPEVKYLQGFSYQFILRQLAVLAILASPAVPQARAQSSALPDNNSQLPTALIRSVRVVPGENGASVEILTTRPLTPSITTVENPLRLVVDLPKSLVHSRMRINYRDAAVQAVRVDQFHQNPPTVRVVIDLVGHADASWDGAGNRLMIRLHPQAPDHSQSAAALAFTQNISLASGGGSEATGDLVLAGSKITMGSSVTAGTDAAVLHTASGGEVRVCPGTTVSVTSSPNGREIMLGMSTGSLEAHYHLETAADSVLTPDFRILFAGPGEFDYAISADSRGNTCVRTLPGNTASAVVSELMGDGMYQVRPAERVVFRSGRLAMRDENMPEDCGCPAVSTRVLRAGAVTEQRLSNESGSGSGSRQANTPGVPAPISTSGQETADIRILSPKDGHIQVDEPLVFRAGDRPMSPVSEARSLPLAHPHQPDFIKVTALPPAIPSETAKVVAQGSRKGFFGRIRGFFGNLLR